eukprot:1161741-Pelagomonas_calceolata.AAC.18
MECAFLHVLSLNACELMRLSELSVHALMFLQVSAVERCGGCCWLLSRQILLRGLSHTHTHTHTQARRAMHKGPKKAQPQQAALTRQELVAMYRGPPPAGATPHRHHHHQQQQQQQQRPQPQPHKPWCPASAAGVPTITNNTTNSSSSTTTRDKADNKAGQQLQLQRLPHEDVQRTVGDGGRAEDGKQGGVEEVAREVSEVRPWRCKARLSTFLMRKWRVRCLRCGHGGRGRAWVPACRLCSIFWEFYVCGGISVCSPTMHVSRLDSLLEVAASHQIDFLCVCFPLAFLLQFAASHWKEQRVFSVCVYVCARASKGIALWLRLYMGISGEGKVPQEHLQSIRVKA